MCVLTLTQILYSFLSNNVGDLHDPEHNSMKTSSSFASVDSINDGTKYGLPFQKDFCLISIDIYSSKTFYDIYNTKTPIAMTVAVAFIFVFTALMFLFYDRLVERRQNLVMDKAMRTNAIVSSVSAVECGSSW